METPSALSAASACQGKPDNEDCPLRRAPVPNYLRRSPSSLWVSCTNGCTRVFPWTVKPQKKKQKQTVYIHSGTSYEAKHGNTTCPRNCTPGHSSRETEAPAYTHVHIRMHARATHTLHTCRPLPLHSLSGSVMSKLLVMPGTPGLSTQHAPSPLENKPKSSEVNSQSKNRAGEPGCMRQALASSPPSDNNKAKGNKIWGRKA